MEAQDPLDVIYLITVLAVNGLGFFIVVVCYAQIYFSLGTETRKRSTTSGEMTVANKMALLVNSMKIDWNFKFSNFGHSQVFTNFACWAPIAFFGLTALAGYPLIDVTKSKILLVFFYPINSCANPYLYAILTAQYRRDFFLLLSNFGICNQRAQLYKMNFSNHTHTHTIPLNQIASRDSTNSNNYRRSRSNPNESFLLTPMECENENGKTEDIQVWICDLLFHTIRDKSSIAVLIVNVMSLNCIIYFTDNDINSCILCQVDVKWWCGTCLMWCSEKLIIKFKSLQIDCFSCERMLKVKSCWRILNSSRDLKVDELSALREVKWNVS